MSGPEETPELLRQRIQQLEKRLEDAESTLEAIRQGEVDAVVINGPAGAQVYTLRSADHPYRILVQEMQEGALTLTPAGLILYANVAFARLLRMPLERVLGSAVQDYVAPGDRQAFLALFERGARGHGRGEVTLQAADGTPVPVLLTCNGLQIDQTRSVCVVVTDLTEQKRQADVLVAETLSRAILEQVAEAVVVLDPAGRVMRASQAAHRLAGRNVLLQEFAAVFPLQVAAPVPGLPLPGTAAVLPAESRGGIEATLARPDGRTFQLLLSLGPLVNAPGEVVGSIVTLIDVTAQQEAEAALRAHEERLRLALDSGGMGTWMWQLASGRSEADAQTLALFGVAAADWHGDPEILFARIVAEDRPHFERAVAEALQHRAPYRAEFRVALADGTVRWLAGEGRTAYDAAGRAVVMCGVNYDITARKEADEALRASEARLRLATEAAEVGLWWWEPETDRAFWDERVRAMWGLAPDAEVTLAGFLAALHPDDHARAQEAVVQVLHGAETYEIEARALHPDGTVRWIYARARLFPGAPGRSARLIGVNLDVTARKAAEEALREQQRFIERVVTTLPDVVYLLDLQAQRPLYTSRRGEDEFGYTAAEVTLLGAALLPTVVHPDDLDRLDRLAARWETARDSDVLETELRLRRKDGTWGWRLVRETVFARDAAGRVRQILGVAQDVTARKQAEVALQESVARYRALTEAVPSMTFEGDPAGGNTFASASWCRYTGLTPAATAGLGWVQAVHPEDRPASQARWGAAMAAGTPCEMRHRLRAADGTYRWFLVRALPLRDGQGTITRWVGSCTDIEDLVRAEATLQGLNATLERRVQERTAALEQSMAEQQRLERQARRAEHFALLGRLAAGVSHELRNPLGAVFLNVDLLDEELRDLLPAAEVGGIAESLAEIRTHLARVEDLVEDYLSLVRVGTLERTVQDLGVALQGWAAEFQALAAAQGMTLRTEGLADLGAAACHANTLQRALLNLVQNALEAMAPGGTVSLRGRGTATHVELQVADTGGGIPAERLAQIFEPLHTTKPGGTGLGLYIVQEVVQAHGGRVTVESVVGQGTTFTLLLPRAPA